MASTAVPPTAFAPSAMASTGVPPTAVPPTAMSPTAISLPSMQKIYLIKPKFVNTISKVDAIMEMNVGILMRQPIGTLAASFLALFLALYLLLRNLFLSLAVAVTSTTSDKAVVVEAKAVVVAVKADKAEEEFAAPSFASVLLQSEP